MPPILLPYSLEGVSSAALFIGKEMRALPIPQLDVGLDLRDPVSKVQRAEPSLVKGVVDLTQISGSYVSDDPFSAGNGSGNDSFPICVYHVTRAVNDIGD
jgi:hypothetical protein